MLPLGGAVGRDPPPGLTVPPLSVGAGSGVCPPALTVPYWNICGKVSNAPPPMFIVTDTLPAALGGVVTITRLPSSATETTVATGVPKLTVRPGTKPLPVRVTVAFPVVAPPVALMPVRVGPEYARRCSHPHLSAGKRCW